MSAKNKLRINYIKMYRKLRCANTRVYKLISRFFVQNAELDQYLLFSSTPKYTRFV